MEYLYPIRMPTHAISFFFKNIDMLNSYYTFSDYREDSASDFKKVFNDK